MGWIYTHMTSDQGSWIRGGPFHFALGVPRLGGRRGAPPFPPGAPARLRLRVRAELRRRRSQQRLRRDDTVAVAGHPEGDLRVRGSGPAVRALVRSRARFKQADNPNVFVVVGDATKLEDVREVVGAADVVVSCLGNPPGGRRNSILIMEKAADCIMKAAEAQPAPPRCLMISSIGVGGSSWFIKAMLTLIGGSAGFADYERAEARVRSETAVSFAVVRPYALNDKPGTGRFKVLGAKAHFASPIPRKDVAHFFMTALGDPQWDGPAGVNIGGA